MSSSHDHYCEKCECHYSPFDFDTCPCGNEGVYDPNGEFGKSNNKYIVFDAYWEEWIGPFDTIEDAQVEENRLNELTPSRRSYIKPLRSPTHHAFYTDNINEKENK